MKHRTRLSLLFLAALVIALSYLGGALAPPLGSASAAGSMGPAAPAQMTVAQFGALRIAMDMLLQDADDVVFPYRIYLPLVRR